MKIRSEELCWWFSRPADEHLNGKNYFFSGNLLIEMFPEFEAEYIINETRRKIQKILENYNNQVIVDDDHDDEGYVNDLSFEYLETTGQFLRYEAIIPKSWLQVLNMNDIITQVSSKVARYYEMNDDIHHAMITIAGITTLLHIINEKFCWWFKLIDDNEPNVINYFFTGTILQDAFPELLDDVEISDDKIIIDC